MKVEVKANNIKNKYQVVKVSPGGWLVPRGVKGVKGSLGCEGRAQHFGAKTLNQPLRLL